MPNTEGINPSSAPIVEETKNPVTTLTPTPVSDPSETPLEISPTDDEEIEENTDYSDLMEKALTNGTVSIIVGLRLPVEFQPEGNLDSPEAIEQQRAMIFQSQESLIAELEGCNFNVYSRYESIPAMAMTVDGPTLEKLIESPIVVTIQEDLPTGG